MSYQLRHDETPGDALRRICRKQIDLAIAIAAGEKEAKDTPVHETRKHLKKRAAALWLVRKEIGRGLFRQQDHCLRDVGRLISEIRDAEVRLQTVRQLQGITRRHQRQQLPKTGADVGARARKLRGRFCRMAQPGDSDVKECARQDRQLAGRSVQLQTAAARRPNRLQTRSQCTWRSEEKSEHGVISCFPE